MLEVGRVEQVVPTKLVITLLSTDGGEKAFLNEITTLARNVVVVNM